MKFATFLLALLSGIIWHWACVLERVIKNFKDLHFCHLMQFKRENVIIQCMLKMWDEFLRLFFSISETTRYTQPFCGHQKICRGDSNNRQVRYSNGQLFVFHQIMDSHLYTRHWDTGLGFAHFSDGFCYLKVCYLDPTVSSVSFSLFNSYSCVKLFLGISEV